MRVAGCEILAELVHGEVYSVHRGRREADGAAVLIKGPQRPPARPEQIEALRSEHALRKDLRVRGVPRALDLACGEGGCWLVLEDAGGVPLTTLLGSGPMALGRFFPLALALAAILAELHRIGLVHRNVQPSSLLVDPATHELWLDGFGLACPEADAAAAPTGLPHPDALAYVSPEQTGRMNRAIDHRADLYSAGVVFYELLAGERPFRSSDPLELVHAHIARTPAAVAEVRPEVPEALSLVVSKLLEKAAEDRYQTAEGLRADLEVCAREWSARRAIAPFPLGARDVSSRFLVPQRLYGRGPRRPARCEGPRAGRSRAEREQQHGARRDEDGGIAGNAAAF